MGEESKERKDPGTLGHGASNTQMNFGQVLTLIQNMQDGVREDLREVRSEIQDGFKEVRAEIQGVDDRDRGRSKELHDKVDKLAEDIDVKVEDLISKVSGLESDKDSFIVQVKDVKKRLDALEEADKDTDEFSDLPFYFRPAWYKAFGVAVAAVIAAVVAALAAAGVFSAEGAEKPAEEPERPAMTAPEDASSENPGLVPAE
jgi:uncharacterized protein YoxC